MAKAPLKKHKNHLMLEAYRFLGINATTEALAAHVLEHGGVDVSTNKSYRMVLKSNAKKQYVAELSTTGRREAPTTESATVPLQDFAALKEMVDRLDDGTVKQLIDLPR